MARIRKFKIRYFRAGYDDEERNATGVHDLLRGIRRKTNKTMEVDGGRIVLSRYERINHRVGDHEAWRGEMRRLRMHDRVAHGNEDGEMEDVQLPDGRYISECSYFVTVPSLKTVAYFSTMHGVSSGQFHAYLNSFLGESQRMELLPILDRRIIEEFARMNQIRKVVLKVAHPQGWAERPDSLAATADLLDRTGGDNITLEISSGRGRPPLRERARQMVSAIARLGRADATRVQKVIVEGKNESDEKMVLDLLKELLIDELTYDFDGIRNIREFRSMCESNLERSITEHLPYIIQTFNGHLGDADE